MPITPDDFDRQPPAESPVTPIGIPIYQQPPPVRVSPAAPAKPGTPGWVKLLVILAILFIFFSMASNGVQLREVPATDTAAVDTMATDTMAIDTMATDTMATDTMATAISQLSLHRGVRRYTPPPWHMPTWTFGPGAGAGVDMVLSSVIVRDQETLVTFDISSDHHDVILYDQLYLIVDGATTLASNSGLEGGRQSSFNNVDSIRRIDIFPGEYIVLFARFPPLPDDAKTLKIVSPMLNGWQSEWYWQNIELRAIAVFPEQ
jgi:hypothetical protein